VRRGSTHHQRGLVYYNQKTGVNKGVNFWGNNGHDNETREKSAITPKGKARVGEKEFGAGEAKDGDQG